MSLSDLILMRDERLAQNSSEVQELAVLTQLNAQLCTSLEKIHRTCPLAKPLVKAATTKVMQCDGSYKEVTSPALQMQVAIPLSKTGDFVLIADDAYISDQFGSGVKSIGFKEIPPAPGSPLAANKKSVETIKDLSKLVLRRAPGLPVEQLTPLPSIDGFTITISIDGVSLLSGPLLPTSDGDLRTKQSEYMVDLHDVVTIGRSEQCGMLTQSMQTLKDTISTTVQRSSPDTVYMTSHGSAVISDTTADRAAIIAHVSEIQSLIVKRFPALEAQRNLNGKLSLELSSNGVLGCHLSMPISSMAIEIDGKVNDRVALGTYDTPFSPAPGSGKASALGFDFGGISFVVDTERQNILGGHYDVPLDPSTVVAVGSIDRAVINKQGSAFDNERFCTREFFILSEKCRYNAFETSTFSLAAVRFFVNGKLFYERNALGVVLDRSRLKLTLPNLYSNPNWIHMMQETDCINSN